VKKQTKAKMMVTGLKNVMLETEIKRQTRVKKHAEAKTLATGLKNVTLSAVEINILVDVQAIWSN